MKVKELKAILNHSDRHDDDIVSIRLSKPSMGPVASCAVSAAQPGFDWDKGSFILYPEKRLAEKSQKEEMYDMAHDLIMFIATEPLKRETFEKRTAVSILRRAGLTEEEIKGYATLFHKDKIK